MARVSRRARAAVAAEPDLGERELLAGSALSQLLLGQPDEVIGDAIDIVAVTDGHVERRDGFPHPALRA